jgi:hypothetical protein
VAVSLARTAGQEGVREVKPSASQCICGQAGQRIATGLNGVLGFRRPYETDENDSHAVESAGSLVFAHLTQPRRSGRGVQRPKFRATGPVPSKLDFGGAVSTLARQRDTAKPALSRIGGGRERKSAGVAAEGSVEEFGLRRGEQRALL